MGENAQEGIFIGTYLFVFIIALSATITMFTMINNYANLAYEYGKDVVGDGTLIKNVTTTASRIVTGDQLISYYYNYIKNEGNKTYNITVYNKEGTKILDASTDYRYDQLLDVCNPTKNYSLVYNRVYNDGFSRKVDIIINEEL